MALAAVVSVPCLLVIGIILTMGLGIFTLFVVKDPVLSPARKMAVKNNLRHKYLDSIASGDLRNISFMTCDNGTVTNAVLADNYCDCKDGSDEMMTAACSHLLPHRPMFDCRDHDSTMIFLSRVNDNVCDCPNGLDEYDSLILCENAVKYYGIKV